MIHFPPLVKSLFLAVALFLAGLFTGCDFPPTPLKIDLSAPTPNNRFVLYKTENVWNFLLLDSQTGRLWQCQYTITTKDIKNEQSMRGCVALDVDDKTVTGPLLEKFQNR